MRRGFLASAFAPASEAGSGSGSAPRRTRAGGVLGRLGRHADLALPAAIVAVVAMMVVPLPAPLLDLLIALNIGVALTLLLVAVYVTDPLKIATLPALLLLTTLFRLGLQISATRLILLNAHAGQVIRAFGDFVVGGNLIVGGVIFAILTVVQYVVISKGSERVAEVAARFALDAMPGKQTSIDADLRAGHIDHVEARRRRGVLEREAQLYGSMDGATKFVKGDAVAGIAVLAVNIAGGLAIGIFQRGLDWTAAGRLYTRLTIGEGLVAQLPSLLISMAAGIVVTRVASEDDGGAGAAGHAGEGGGHLAREIGRQVATHPRALAVAAALLLLFAVVPGLPLAPFLALGAIWALGAWRLVAARRSAAGARAGDVGAATDRARGGHDVPPVPAVAIELHGAQGEDDDEYERDVDADADIDVEIIQAALRDDVLPPLRLRFCTETGIPIPPVVVSRARSVTRARSTPPDGGAAYVVTIRGVPAARGRIPPPAPARPARARAQEIAARLLAALRRHAGDLIGIQETDVLLARLERTHPALVREAVPKALSRATLAAVLRRLAQEGISVRGLGDILEALAARPASEDGDVFALTERARHGLRREITFAFARADTGEGGTLAAHAVDPLIEDTLRDAVRHTPAGRHLALDPDLARDVLDAVARALAPDAEAPAPDRAAVIVTTAELRRHLWELIAPRHPDVTVLSFEELTPDTRIDAQAPVGLQPHPRPDGPVTG